jgi:hypothetical protein
MTWYMTHSTVRVVGLNVETNPEAIETSTPLAAIQGR